VLRACDLGATWFGSNADAGFGSAAPVRSAAGFCLAPYWPDAPAGLETQSNVGNTFVSCTQSVPAVALVTQWTLTRAGSGGFLVHNGNGNCLTFNSAGSSSDYWPLVTRACDASSADHTWRLIRSSAGSWQLAVVTDGRCIQDAGVVYPYHVRGAELAACDQAGWFTAWNM
jgi:hypothetical protein